MISKDVLSTLGAVRVIVNIARVSVIDDEEEIVRCRERGEIRCAGLDVFENESSVFPNNPLHWTMLFRAVSTLESEPTLLIG